MVSILQIDYRFNIISIKTLEAFLVEIDKLILKYTLKKAKEFRMSKRF